MKIPALWFALFAIGFGANAHAANSVNIPAPVAFCLDHPALCGHCPDCAKGQLDISIPTAAGEKACIANGGTVVMNMNGSKICGGHYMRRQGPPQSQPGPLPH